MRIRGHVVLDSTWAHYLGVRRSGGTYRITRRELLERLKQFPLATMQRLQSTPAVVNHVVAEFDGMAVERATDNHNVELGNDTAPATQRPLADDGSTSGEIPADAA